MGIGPDTFAGGAALDTVQLVAAGGVLVLVLWAAVLAVLAIWGRHRPRR